MVTFNCEVCNATVPKKNTEKHYYRCPDAYFTCIDCSTTFDDGVSYKKHTQCITEDEKYQKALYKGKKAKNQQQEEKPKPKKTETSEKPEKSIKPAKSAKNTEKASSAPAKKSPLVPGTSLYKVLKGMKSKQDKKELLKRLEVTSEGSIILTDSK
ncbi:HHL209Cp [Eremothecium sinecaudum]|uniref:HHL209Cp n=1 Tax=Eremothecium sinecaudum TaxID=45286 RepID=A0A109UYE0_9SACH|nr:HHL209Cp [Eremothecium sinecaudum]AMD22561.1 HHL209Cp [Eremothecium sinecaudum]